MLRREPASSVDVASFQRTYRACREDADLMDLSKTGKSRWVKTSGVMSIITSRFARLTGLREQTGQFLEGTAVMPQEPPYPLIRESLVAGRVIPFLGAGASLSEVVDPWSLDANVLPLGGQLADHLAAYVQFPEDEAKDLAKVAQYYEVVGGRSPLQATLREIFNRDYPIGRIHEALAGIDAPLLIVTTNYDDLMERALTLEGRPFERIVHTTDPELGDELLWWQDAQANPVSVMPNSLDTRLDRTTVYKMHGAVDRIADDRDQFVITEDDYVEFLSRMTRQRAIPASLAEPFQHRHFLFLGYGLGDWNLRVLLNRIHNDRTRASGITSWAIQRNPSRLEEQFWQRRGVMLFDVPLDEFTERLALP